MIMTLTSTPRPDRRSLYTLLLYLNDLPGGLGGGGGCAAGATRLLQAPAEGKNHRVKPKFAS
jgi:hypothetical protein